MLSKKEISDNAICKIGIIIPAGAIMLLSFFGSQESTIHLVSCQGVSDICLLYTETIENELSKKKKLYI
jgi:hypothetical protein